MTSSSEPFSDSLLLKSIEPVLPVDRTPGIGCIGAGFIMADCQLVAYRQHGLNPVAITSRTRSTAENVAARHRIKAVCDSVEAVVNASYSSYTSFRNAIT